MVDICSDRQNEVDHKRAVRDGSSLTCILRSAPTTLPVSSMTITSNLALSSANREEYSGLLGVLVLVSGATIEGTGLLLASYSVVVPAELESVNIVVRATLVTDLP